MSGKDLILLVIAILVGLGLGYAIWEKKLEEPDPVEYHMTARWTTNPCPPPAGVTCADKLQEIIETVLALPLAEQTPQALHCAARAWLVGNAPITIPLAQAVDKVKRAHDWAHGIDADSGATLTGPDWGKCGVELDGIH